MFVFLCVCVYVCVCARSCVCAGVCGYVSSVFVVPWVRIPVCVSVVGCACAWACVSFVQLRLQTEEIAGVGRAWPARPMCDTDGAGGWKLCPGPQAPSSEYRA